MVSLWNINYQVDPPAHLLPCQFFNFSIVRCSNYGTHIEHEFWTLVLPPAVQWIFLASTQNGAANAFQVTIEALIKALFPNRDLFGKILGISTLFLSTANREEIDLFLWIRTKIELFEVHFNFRKVGETWQKVQFQVTSGLASKSTWKLLLQNGINDFSIYIVSGLRYNIKWPNHFFNLSVEMSKW